MRGKEGASAGHDALVTALEDKAPSVRIAAAQCLAQFGPAAELDRSLDVLINLANLQEKGLYVALLAINAIDELDNKAVSIKARIAELPLKDNELNPKFRNYVMKLVEKTLSDFE